MRKKIFLAISAITFYVFSFVFSSLTYAQYESEQLPVCSGGRQAGTCLGNGVTCNTGALGCTYYGETPTCPSNKPIKRPNNRCTSCTGGYHSNATNTDCIPDSGIASLPYCPNGQKAIACPLGRYSCNGLVGCACPGEDWCLLPSGGKPVCDATHPYVDTNGACVSCNGTWDNTAKTCKLSPTPTVISNPTSCIQIAEDSHSDPCPAGYYCAGPGSGTSDGCARLPIKNKGSCIAVSEDSHNDPCPAWHDKSYYCAGPGSGTPDGCTQLQTATTGSCSGQKTINGDKVEYSCDTSCTGDLHTSNSKLSCGNGLTCCYRDISSGDGNSSAGTTGSGRSSSPGNSSGGSNARAASCPMEGDTCFYTDDSGACYSGSGATGINVEGCQYSCGPVDKNKCKVSEKDENKKAKSSKKIIDCTVGEPQNECKAKCKNGGTCKQGHTFCEWTEDGNVESDCVCDDEKGQCANTSTTTAACKDNPTSPPSGYTWKNSCKACSSNDDCPKNTKDASVSPDTSNWCYAGSCLQLISGGSVGSSSKNTTTNNKKQSDKDKQKEKDKKKKAKDVNDGKTKDDTGNKTKQNNEKCPRDLAQKPIDKLNKDRLNQKLPTLTPLPPDCNYTPSSSSSTTPTTTANKNGASATPTVSPTPLPPLAEPTNWQAICGPTTNAAKPLGIRFSWNAVTGAERYAVRIDEDAPSWEGDTPSPGDTVDNTLKDTSYTRVAKVGSTYQLWVHSVNASGVYSALSKKIVVKCPTSATNPVASSSAGSVGAGQLIVLP